MKRYFQSFNVCQVFFSHTKNINQRQDPMELPVTWLITVNILKRMYKIIIILSMSKSRKKIIFDQQLLQSILCLQFLRYSLKFFYIVLGDIFHIHSLQEYTYRHFGSFLIGSHTLYCRVFSTKVCPSSVLRSIGQVRPPVHLHCLSTHGVS